MPAANRPIESQNAQSVPQGKPYLHWLLVANALAFYLYLFWDSLKAGTQVLSGAQSDMLFIQKDRFMDWINTLWSAGLIHPYNLEGQIAMPVYGPFTYLALKPIAQILASIPSSLVLAKALWVCITGAVVLSAVRNIERIRGGIDSSDVKAVSSWLLAAVILMSYPFMFAFDRGNLEVITFGLVSWYLSRTVCCEESRAQNGLLPSLKTDIILALAVSLKPYVCLFAICQFDKSTAGIRLVRKRIITSFARILALTLLISVISLDKLYQGNWLAGYRELQHWQLEFRSTYVLGNAGDLFFTSPYVAIKKILANAVATPDWSINIYVQIYPVAALLVSSAVFLTIFRSRLFRSGRRSAVPLLLTAIVFTLLVFPFNASEYKAVYALLPFILAYSAPAEKQDESTDSSTLARSTQVQIRPEALSIGVWFLILLNRYGWVGNNLIAAMLGSLTLLLFPLVLSLSCLGEARMARSDD